MPWKSSRFWRKTVVFTSRSRLVPASARIAREVREDLLGLLLDRAAGELLVARLQRELARHEDEAAGRIACEYGAPWNGAGAASVRTTVLSATVSSFRLRTPGTAPRRAP